jgi:hypothetical protein
MFRRMKGRTEGLHPRGSDFAPRGEVKNWPLCPTPSLDLRFFVKFPKKIIFLQNFCSHYVEPIPRWLITIPAPRSRQPGVDVMITIFCDFRQFSAKKLAFFLKNQCYDHFFGISWLCVESKMTIFSQKFSAKIFWKSSVPEHYKSLKND